MKSLKIKSEHIISCYLMNLIENFILWLGDFTNHWKNTSYSKNSIKTNHKHIKSIKNTFIHILILLYRFLVPFCVFHFNRNSMQIIHDWFCLKHEVRESKKTERIQSVIKKHHTVKIAVLPVQIIWISNWRNLSLKVEFHIPEWMSYGMLLSKG
jgi:hypothetical protein